MRANADHVHGTSLRVAADQAKIAITAIFAQSKTFTTTATLASWREPGNGVVLALQRAVVLVEQRMRPISNHRSSCLEMSVRCSHGFHWHFEAPLAVNGNMSQ
mmetsp:Transcript_49118/g.116964  ORF Transcript_49118/g.116964 Transcript_49118/m.116964 type:complete len:103 (-) Transcript_49118:268-576(-)